MLKRRIATATVVICLMGLARLAMAQNSSDQQFRPFNGLFANMFDDGSQLPPPQHQMQHNYDYDSSGTAQPQRVPTRATKPQPAPQLDADLPAAPVVDNYKTELPPRPVTLRSPVTGNNYSFQYDGASPAGGPAPIPPPPNGAPSSDAAISSTPGIAYSWSAAPAGLPLHERLKIFRQSPFGDVVQATPSALDPPPPASGHAAVPAQTVASRPAETPAVAQHTPTPATPAPDALPPPPTDAEPQHLATAGAPGTPGRANDAGVVGQGPQLPDMQNPAAGTRYSGSPPGGAPSTLGRDQGTNDAAQEPSVLIDHKSPMLSVETIGPRKIVVGKEAAYEVLLQNSGNVAAEEVTVTVSLPDWAELAGSSASSGEVRPIATQGTGSPDRHDPCRWVLGRIEARSKEKLALKIIPRQSKPFELAVRWDFKQAPSHAMIEVQEPKLTMRLDGPREVFFGKREIYKLKLGNSGNGVAENVMLTLMPLNSGDTHPITHRLGTIDPGGERSIEIELTARQAGKITIRVEASGDGGAHVDLAEHVLVHRAALQVNVEGPAMQFVGTPTRFKIHVNNPGDAAAKHVKLTAKLPTGVKFVSGSNGAIAETAVDGGRVRWTLDPLQPGEQRVLEMKCTLALSGVNRLEFTSAADDDLVAAAKSITRVEAMADLRLDVKDPEGPVPIGSAAIYELHVRNRGTKAAENVEVLAYFSGGVEPVSADGQTHRISPGQVIFDRIPAIPPATELVLKVKAKAEVAGNHVFRAELHCKALGTRLVREEETYYYQDGPSLQQAAAGAPGTPRVPGGAPSTLGPGGAKLTAAPATRDELRTAERQAPLPLPQSSEQPLPTPAVRR